MIQIERLKRLNGRQIKYLPREDANEVLTAIAQLLGLADESGLITISQNPQEEQEKSWQNLLSKIQQ